MSAVGSAFAVVVTLATGACDRQESTDGRTAGAPQVSGGYAYLTERNFVLMRGDQEIAQVPRRFSETDSQDNKVVWTHNGRYAVFFAEGPMTAEKPPGATELVVVEAGTGEVRRISCPNCDDLTPIEDAAILAMVDEATLLRFDLGSSTPATPKPLDLAFQFTVEAFLDSSPHYVATRRTESGSRHDQGLELTPIDGSVGQNIGTYESNSYLFAAMTESAGKPTFAFATRPDPGQCVAEFPIFVAAPGEDLARTDMSAAEPPGYVKGRDGGVDVGDLWWGLDGQLRASIAAWTCDPARSVNGKKKTTGPDLYTVWKLDGKKWVRDTTSPPGFVRDLGPDDRVALRLPTCRLVPDRAKKDCRTGTVYRHTGGAEKRIADDALAITAPAPDASTQPPTQ